ncbi:MAG: redox-sensing transcriptional repressor Rex [Planctomycetota bacterium]|jgi:redox-sensing transcriptional repressor
MSKQEHVPLPAVRRLSLYLRQFELIQASDRQTVSSKQLGAALGISDAQIRKDLAYFGQFGHPGIGYRVPEMIARLRRILGTDRKSNVAVVGAGNLGRALLSYKGFANKGFEIVAVFDNNDGIIGHRVGPKGGIKIHHPDEMRAMIHSQNIRLGILAVPGPAAQLAADQMIEAGMRAILSFAPCTIQVPDSVAVSSVDLSVQLEQLAFQISTVGT